MKLGKLSYKNIRCTQATLESFGIFGKCPRTGSGLESELRKKYEIMLHDVDGLNKLRKNKLTVGSFAKLNPKGKFYISTDGHAMSLIDGVLTDTTERGFDRRIIISIFSVNESSEPKLLVNTRNFLGEWQYEPKCNY